MFEDKDLIDTYTRLDCLDCDLWHTTRRLYAEAALEAIGREDISCDEFYNGLDLVVAEYNPLKLYFATKDAMTAIEEERVADPRFTSADSLSVGYLGNHPELLMIDFSDNMDKERGQELGFFVTKKQFESVLFGQDDREYSLLEELSGKYS